MFKHTFITLTVSVLVLGLLSVFQPQPLEVEQPIEQKTVVLNAAVKSEQLQVEEGFGDIEIIKQEETKEEVIIVETEQPKEEVIIVETEQPKEEAKAAPQAVEKKEVKKEVKKEAKPAPVVASKPVEKAPAAPEVKADVSEEPKEEVAPAVEVAPAPAPAPAAPKVSTTPAATWQLEIARLTNIEREKAGLSILTYNTSLEAGANIRANEIIDNFSHTRPDGSRFFTAFGDLQYKNIGENLGKGFRSPESIVSAWMNSEGHRSNILKPEYQEISVAITKDADGKYRWVQIFYRGR
jgi:uncharacterized protein YkwD